MQVISDIHLEHYKDKFAFTVPITAPYLILAGDIGNPYRANYYCFLEWCDANYEQVFLVSGNHEYYHGCKRRTITEVDEHIDTVTKKISQNLHYLKAGFCEPVRLNNIAVIGTTLWTQIPEKYHDHVQKGMNDYEFIYDDQRKKITPKSTTEIHLAEKNWLEQHLNKISLDETIEACIVITHHLPSEKMLNPAYAHEVEINTAYAADLEEMILRHPKIRYWVNGHTHLSTEEKVGETSLFSNCYGYKNQQTGYAAERILKINV